MIKKYIDTSIEPIFRRLMGTLLVLLVILFIGLEFLLWEHYREHTISTAETDTEHIMEHFQILLNQEINGMNMALQPIIADEKTQLALKEADYESLLAHWIVVFNAMKTENKIAEFSFFDIHCNNIAQVHSFKKEWDEFDMEDEDCTKSSLGIEVGSWGTLYLHTIQPIYQKNVLVGYVELSKNIEDILEILQKTIQSNLAILVSKSYLNQEDWEDGMLKLKRSWKWNDLTSNVVSYASQGFLPPFFISIAEVMKDNQGLEATFDKKNWFISKKILYNAKNKRVGNLFIMHNISNEKEDYLYFMLKSAAVGLCILMVVLVLIHLLLHEANTRIIVSREVLNRIEKIASRISCVIFQFRLRPDKTTSFPYVSDAIRQIYRVSPEEVKNDASKISTIIHPADMHKVITAIRQSAQDLTPWRQEYRVKYDDGTVRWLYGNAMPERELDGSTLWHGYIDDITERKALEDELHQMNELLDLQVEQEVSARMKIQREQEAERQFLIQKSKLSSMGEMMGAIAHQWRQPLNALNMNIQNLDDDFEEGLVTKEFIDVFIAKNKQTISFMSKTIDDFRNFFKTDKEKKEFSILNAIAETVALQSAQLKNLHIQIFIKGEDVIRFGFRGEFQQVILNIINNAKDAIVEQKTNEGKIIILLNHDLLTIENNGGRIKEEILERIFEPYFSTKGEGVGIGLYLSKVIIEKNMGWKLYAHNTEDGVCFTIDFKS